jgi:hypothetical protein
MTDEPDAGWDDLKVAATHLAAQLQPVIPAQVNWSVFPFRRRSILNRRTEDMAFVIPHA